jgi:hypothetical protein
VHSNAQLCAVVVNGSLPNPLPFFHRDDFVTTRPRMQLSARRDLIGYERHSAPIADKPDQAGAKQASYDPKAMNVDRLVQQSMVCQVRAAPHLPAGIFSP